MLLGDNHPNNENKIDSKKYHIFYDKKVTSTTRFFKKKIVSFNSLMYIMQNIEKSQDTKGFTFSIFWVKNRDFKHFHEITVMCAIKCKVHNFCLTKFFWKFVIKINSSKLDFYVIYAIFPHLTLPLATHPHIP